MIVAGVRDGKNYEPLNLFLNLVNTLNYIYWTGFIFRDVGFSTKPVLLFVGLICLLAALAYYRFAPGAILSAGAWFVAGLLVIAGLGPVFAGDFTAAGLHYVVQGSIWLALAVLLYGIGLKERITGLIYGGLGAWLLVLIYWYTVAWEVEWVEWFGLPYIPFMNPGALLWIALATFGFIVARKNDLLADEKPGEFSSHISTLLALLPHLVVGGLLTIQLINFREAYGFDQPGKKDFVLSLVWGVYAALLFLWGGYTNKRPFQIAGSVVLALVALKALLLDLSEVDGLYKALFLFLMGLLSLGIFGINQYFERKNKTVPAPEESAEDDKGARIGIMETKSP